MISSSSQGAIGVWQRVTRPVLGLLIRCMSISAEHDFAHCYIINDSVGAVNRGFDDGMVPKGTYAQDDLSLAVQLYSTVRSVWTGGEGEQLLAASTRFCERSFHTASLL